MPKLIEIANITDCPSRLSIRAGDVLLFRATGARLLSGTGILEPLGSFVDAVLGTNGEVFSPAGPPSTVLLRANQEGDASVALITGDPFHSPRSTELLIAVSP